MQARSGLLAAAALVVGGVVVGCAAEPAGVKEETAFLKSQRGGPASAFTDQSVTPPLVKNLPPDSLRLTAAEKRALVRFMEALTDTAAKPGISP